MAPGRRYEVVEHTAETGIRALGKGLNELFANAAYGMFDLMTDVTRVRAKGEYEVRLAAPDLPALLVDWLTQLLYLHETQSVYLSEFDVDVRDLALTARVRGEKIDRRRHRPRTAVKAVTYHMLTLRPEEGYAVVILDV